MNFDLNYLRSFVLVADTMSFSRAAERVCRSQSTVSQQINKLEEQIGKRLLVRRKGRVLQLTPDGGKLLRYASRIIQLNDEAYSSMCDDVLVGSVRLGVPLDFFGRDFTTWLAEFKRLHPMVALEVESNQSEHLRKCTERGQLDLAFFKQAADSDDTSVALREQMVWVVGPNFAPSLDRSLPLVLFPEGCAYRRFAISTLRSHNIPWHISFVSPSFECLKTATVEGLGITVLARVLVSPQMRIIERRLGLPSLPIINLVYMFGRDENSRGVKELAHFLVDRLVKAGPDESDSVAHVRERSRVA